MMNKLIKETYKGKTVKKYDESISQLYLYEQDTASFYISVAKNYFLTTAEARNLLRYVRAGNTAFISSAYIDTSLLNEIGLQQNIPPRFSQSLPESMQTAKTKIVKDIVDKDSIYSYFYLPFSASFTGAGGENQRIVGKNNEGKENCVVVFIGKGRLYLHADPRAFSNYFLMTGKNRDYALQLLQIMPESPTTVYTDTYYVNKNYREERNSAFWSALKKHPPLAWAFYLLIVLFLLYVLVNGKRRQKIIPIIPPVENASIAFAEAISRLYYKEKDNKGIALKMIQYFREHLRSKYFFNAKADITTHLEILSKKAGVPLEQTENLFARIAIIEQNNSVTDEQLLQLNKGIEKFNKPNN